MPLCDESLVITSRIDAATFVARVREAGCYSNPICVQVTNAAPLQVWWALPFRPAMFNGTTALVIWGTDHTPLPPEPTTMRSSDVIVAAILRLMRSVVQSNHRVTKPLAAHMFAIDRHGKLRISDPSLAAPDKAGAHAALTAHAFLAFALSWYAGIDDVTAMAALLLPGGPAAYDFMITQ